jgi:hypothetical protein
MDRGLAPSGPQAPRGLGAWEQNQIRGELMSKDVKVVSFNVLPILGVVFVTLKLMGYINWSWWWVTLPFWGVPSLFLGVAIVCFVAQGLIVLIEKKAP